MTTVCLKVAIAVVTVSERLDVQWINGRATCSYTITSSSGLPSPVTVTAAVTVTVLKVTALRASQYSLPEVLGFYSPKEIHRHTLRLHAAGMNRPLAGLGQVNLKMRRSS